ncbi:MAG: bifunctional phosphoribosylaminoimidazolecarboxamide formyltransferase/IMP cyclohydrolase [Bdellovibrionales bacterium]|nr:bifunctional phosphoribosylaminoimidazolecarboxamide formyltransferase/IMP cyclohydrolase [Bdellovibrionales bacterium]
MFRNALVSVSDKTGLEAFLKPLADQGMRIVSSGGTARYLEERGFKIIKVSEQTQFPEVMGGRVKTLHPYIHMPLLYRSEIEDDLSILKEHGLEPFDLVVVNLYPFTQALDKNLPLAEMVELIDIGGPTLLRASAKNFKNMTVVCDPSDYEGLLQKGKIELEDRKALAAKVFRHVSSYDHHISNYLSAGDTGEVPALQGDLKGSLRYGENPHQKAFWYQSSSWGLHQAQILQGKELSYNNLLDLDAALRSLFLFEGPTVISVKHNNPCGVARVKNIFEALQNSLQADPVSVFGGIIALNEPIDGTCAKELSGLFLECIVAPQVTDEAKDIFKKKSNLRVLEWPQMLEKSFSPWEYRSIMGGYLAQSQDRVPCDRTEWQLKVGELSENQWLDLEFAWKVCASLKSNAIAVTCGQQSVGLGMGQVNRVDAVQQALERAQKFHPGKKPLYLASDAFFPFPDSVEIAAEYGVKAIIQPGGSVKDAEVIAAAEKHGIPMVMTGRRHFRH